jgi:hypothetical protein
VKWNSKQSGVQRKAKQCAQANSEYAV